MLIPLATNSETTPSVHALSLNESNALSFVKEAHKNVSCQTVLRGSIN